MERVSQKINLLMYNTVLKKKTSAPDIYLFFRFSLGLRLPMPYTMSVCFALTWSIANKYASDAASAAPARAPLHPVQENRYHTTDEHHRRRGWGSTVGRAKCEYPNGDGRTSCCRSIGPRAASPNNSAFAWENTEKTKPRTQ